MDKLVVCLLLFAAAVTGKHEKYEGHQLYRIGGPAQEIGTLQANLDLLSATPALTSKSGQFEALVRLSPEEKETWLSYFEEKDIVYTKIIDDLAVLLREQDVLNAEAKSASKKQVVKAIASEDTDEDGEDSGESSESNSESGESSESNSESDESSSEETAEAESEEEDSATISWDAYHTFEEINNWIDEIGRKHSDKVVVVNAALSYEGRQIRYCRISTTNFENTLKPVIIIDAGAHAREWVTAPVAMYIIKQLVDGVDSELLDKIDWVIIPMVNPDGYEHSMTMDRMWRKTRSLNHPGSFDCPGVDVNRNFDHHHGTNTGASDPCALIYEGPTAFSESETRVVRDAVLAHLSRATMYISLHSFGQMFLYAWGNNGTLPQNGLGLHLAGVEMASAIDAVALPNVNSYVVGNAANVLYYTTGTSRDWTRAIGIPLTYTLELPGYEYGFLVPPTYIKQIVTETWAGIAAGGHHILRNY